MDDLPPTGIIGIFPEIALSIGSDCVMMIFEMFKGVQVVQCSVNGKYRIIVMLHLPADFLWCTSGCCIVDYQWRFHSDFLEPRLKPLAPARVLRVTDGDGFYAAVGRERMKGEL